MDNLEWVSSAENLQHAHNKPVYQLNSDGSYLNTFKSINDASEETGINCKNISSALRKNMKAGGYIWQYASEKYTNVTDINGENLFVSSVFSNLKFTFQI